MSVNKYNQVVCDMTKIILEDGVTLYPGYVEVKDKALTVWDSDDPNNEIAQSLNPNKGYKPGMLHHRVQYKRAVKTLPVNDPNLEGKHFISLSAMDKYLTTAK